MARFKDETGNQYGRLTVLRQAESAGRVKWECVCVCGSHVSVVAAKLRNGHTKSCGCLSREITAELNRQRPPEFMKGHPAKNSFKSAKNRCENLKNPAYHNYGGRGIEFRFESMEQFWEELGDSWEVGLSIDRKDVNGHYEPGNCRWATDQTQAQNRRDTVLIAHQGETMCLAEWARKIGVTEATMRSRFRQYGHNPAKLFAEVETKFLGRWKPK